ncbi:hypothetical protein BJV74DRAFT_891176 [Russula compacta]|nr:hypothetical protein BJV74DRAFT_891176 [Russula compacta]
MLEHNFAWYTIVPWVDKLIINIKPPPRVDPMNTVCYTNNCQWDLAVAAELKSFINMEHTNIVQTAQDVATYLLSMQAAYFVTDYDCTQVPQLMKHLSDPTRPEKKYLLLGSVLYAKEDKDHHQPFKCKALLELLISVLHGKSAINAKLIGQSRHPDKATIWGIMKMTPAMDEPSHSDVNDLIQYLESTPREASSDMPALPLPLSASEDAPSATPALPPSLSTSEEAPSTSLSTTTS